MTTAALTICPRCGQPLASGFAARSAGLSFVAPDKLKQFAFLDEDLSGAGLTKLLPSKAAYFRSHLCRGCELYLIDFSTALSGHEAERLADSLARTG